MIRFLLLFVVLLGIGLSGGRSATETQAYTDFGKTDFDTVLGYLEPHGTWEKVVVEGAEPGAAKVWAWFPAVAQAPGWGPFRRGTWSYSDFGWHWTSDEPFGFATYHYGYWGRDPSKGWYWVPGGRWEAATVEWRVAGDYYGWRPQRTDRFGEPVMALEASRRRVEEWYFVPKTALLSSLDRADVLGREKIRELLAISEVGVHQRSIPNYREFTRVGPAPEDVALLTGVPMPDVRRTMALPSPETPVPAGYGPGFLFVYRPKFHQDDTGIVRRITLWHERKKGGAPIDTQKVAESLMEDIIRQKAEEIREKKKNGTPTP